MKCPNCQNEVNEGQQFCPNCGNFIKKEALPPRFEYAKPPSENGGSRPPSPFQPVWVPVLLFFLAGLLIAFYAFSPRILDWTFGIWVYPYIAIPILAGVLIGALLLVLLIAKSDKGKARLIIGLGLASLGLLITILAPALFIFLPGLLFLVAGIALLLSFLGRQGKPRYWLYPVSGIAGAALYIVSRITFLENFGPRSLSITMLVVTLLIGIPLMIFGRDERFERKRISFGQLAAVIGTCVALLLMGFFL